MHKPTVSEADLLRLKEERDAADRLYNEALTGLDRALTAPRALPAGAAHPDTSQLERLNRLWQIVPPDPVPFGGMRRRLGAFVWRVVGPMLQRQQEFNAALVDHANRNAARAGESAEAIGALAASVGEELRAVAAMQAQLIRYLQQVTLYVDTKDRYETGLLWHELRARTDGLAAGLSALGDELLKRREDGRLRGQRVEARIAEVRTEVRQRLAEAGTGAADPATGRSEAAATVVAGQGLRGEDGGSGLDEGSLVRGQLADEAHASAYAGFEDLYRGSAEEIGERLGEYVTLFDPALGEVVDLGCGRGELLQVLASHDIAARGIDVNPAMVERCRALGLDVQQGEALAFLGSLPDASLGGVVAAQVVEHLAPTHLLGLLDAARAKLRPGGRIVLETVNPACWAAFFSSYIRDITHVRPIHPDTLRYLLIARGFADVDIRFSSPYPAGAKLHPLPLTLAAEGSAVMDVVREFNRNVEILNAQLFTYLDYAAIAVKPS